jgi:hypothetical protein
MRRLNGWKRLGVLASVAWFLGAGYWEWNNKNREDIMLAVNKGLACQATHNGADPGNACFIAAEKYGESLVPSERNAALIVGLVPIPFAWGFVYFFLFVAGWVKRGFYSNTPTQAAHK